LFGIEKQELRMQERVELSKIAKTWICYPLYAVS
jgi:hypothetical protein